MNEKSPLRISNAVDDFRRARRMAALQEVFARITGKSIQLLPFEEVRQNLKGETKIPRGLKVIPLDAIVGSVGRYADFTRNFLPRQDLDADRWAKVKVQVTDLGKIPPIEVYQIGEVYFVLDGNHRVSVARNMGATYIDAYVTEINTKVSIRPEDQPDDLILKSEFADFLESTRLDEYKPEVNLHVTAPGNYRYILHQIEEIREEMQNTRGKNVQTSEAAIRWYKKYYIPVIQVIKERGLLREFPNRTATDLFIWISKRQEQLTDVLGWEVSIERTAQDLVAQMTSDPQRVAARIGDKLYDVLTPDPLESGPKPGHWRKETLSTHQRDHLFTDILVPISGETKGWIALDQALALASWENDYVHGLHVVRTEDDRTSPQTRSIREEFEYRCQKAGVHGSLAVEVGKPPRKICEFARWVDLVVINVRYPPKTRPISKLASGLRTIIRRCCRPILAVPQVSPTIDRMLLAYDDSPKAREALFIATYIAGKWGKHLDILCVIEIDSSAARAHQSANEYLEMHNVKANFISAKGDVAKVILTAAEEHNSDLIIMGGYGFSPVLEVVLGSAVDQVLRESIKPVLICR